MSLPIAVDTSGMDCTAGPPKMLNDDTNCSSKEKNSSQLRRSLMCESTFHITGNRNMDGVAEVWTSIDSLNIPTQSCS